MVTGFLVSLVKSVFDRAKLLAVLNGVYFGGIFVTALAAGLLSVQPPYEGWNVEFQVSLFGEQWLLMAVGIFLFNLIVSAFAVVTVPGFVFFPLSCGFVAFRAFLWGLMISPLPFWVLLVALPTMILEGEAYVFAGAAGTVLGMSWLKPAWVTREASVSRFAALKLAFKESKRFYVFVVLFLFLAALVETVALVSL